MTFHRLGRLHLEVGWKHFHKQVLKVLRNPIFAVMTIVGNLCVLLASGLFYLFEKDPNPHVERWFDALWWAAATVTTVGYGDVTPVTVGGRLVGIALMVTGGTLFLSFIALFASALIELELGPLEEEIEQLRSQVDRLSQERSPHQD